MQKFVQLLAEKFVEGDTYLEDLVEERVREIKNKKIEKLKHVDEKDLYDVIEQNSPFKKDDWCLDRWFIQKKLFARR